MSRKSRKSVWREFKGFIFLFFLALGLILFVFWDGERLDEGKKAHDDELRFFSEKLRDKISGIQIENWEGVLELQIKDGSWSVVSPFEDLADQSFVDGLLDLLFRERILRTVGTDSSPDWETFGLGDPEVQIMLFQGEDKIGDLALSSTKTYDDNLYARQDGSDRVLIVSSSIEQRLMESFSEYRNKLAFRFLSEFSKLRELDIDKGAAAFSLLKSGNDWIFPDEENHYPIDEMKVRSFFRQLSSLRLSAFLEDLSSVERNREVYFLKPPSIQWTLRFSDKSEVYLQVSRPNPGDPDSRLRYLVGSDFPVVASHGIGELEDFFVDKKDFYDRRAPFYELLMMSREWDQITWESEGEKFLINNIQGKWILEGDEWNLLEDGLQALLSRLNLMEVDWIDKTGQETDFNSHMRLVSGDESWRVSWGEPLDVEALSGEQLRVVPIQVQGFPWVTGVLYDEWEILKKESLFESIEENSVNEPVEIEAN